MQTRTPLNVAAPLVAGALLGRLAASVRLAAPVQAKDKPPASAELDHIVRQVFGLANQYMRWEFDDLARRLNEQPVAAELRDGLMPARASSASGLTPDGRRMLPAIDELPEDERDVFDPLRIQGMKQAEAAQALDVSAVTVKRRLSRFVERMLTVVATCRQRGINVLDYLTRCYQAHLDGQPAPSLRPSEPVLQAARSIIKPLLEP
jgi:Sigma-70, region 4